MSVMREILRNAVSFRSGKSGMIDLEYSEILSEVSIDHFQFKVTWSPLNQEACILWFMDSRVSELFEALGQFSSYNQRNVLEFITRYVCSEALRKEIDALRFERRVDNLSPSFFREIERLSASDKEQAYRSLFNLDDIIAKQDLSKRRNIMAKRFHPDAGGDVKVMSIINEAYEYLVKQID